MLNSAMYSPQFAGMQGYFGAGMMAPQGFGGMQGMMGMGMMGRMDMVSVSMFQINMFCCPSQPTRISEDPYGVAQSGQGMRSNLANSPEVMLALRDIFQSGKAQSYEDVQKVLKDEYGIQAEVGDIEVAGKDGNKVKGKGLKFANGDYFVDGNGDNILTTADYKFDDAVKALKDKYNLGDEDLKGITDNMKNRAKAGYSNGPVGGMNGGMGISMMGVGMTGMMQPGMFGPMMGNQWMMMFARAFQMAA